MAIKKILHILSKITISIMCFKTKSLSQCIACLNSSVLFFTSDNLKALNTTSPILQSFRIFEKIDIDCRWSISMQKQSLNYVKLVKLMHDTSERKQFFFG